MSQQNDSLPVEAGSNKTLLQVVEDFRDLRFVLVEPGGNFGDKLIYVGAEALFRAAGAKWERVSRSEFMRRPGSPGEVAYLHGSGGFNRWCSGWALRLVERALAAGYRAAIQGPQTVDEDEEYVRHQLLPVIERGRETELVFFARELSTYRLLSRHWSAAASLYLDEDTALHTPPADLSRFLLGGAGYDLLALREDPERPAPVSERVTVTRDAVELDPPYFARTFEHWVRLHACARSIVTNRTHSSVLGALLGKDVTLLAGSYHKNRSIWEYSLKHRGVRWSDGFAEIPRGICLSEGAGWLRKAAFMARLAVHRVPLR